MASPSFGLVVEGLYDEAVFKHLIPRLFADVTPILVVRPAFGVKRLLSGFPGLLGDLEHWLAGHPVDKALVIRDTGGRTVEEVEGQLAARLAGREFRFPRGVQLCGVRQEIESWLLADEDAITAVARDRRVGRRQATRVNEPPEDIVHAKERLQEALSGCGLLYGPAVCGGVAARLDLDRLRYRCPSFNRFETKLHDC